jgi:hypothetical protein
VCPNLAQRAGLRLAFEDQRFACAEDKRFVLATKIACAEELWFDLEFSKPCLGYSRTLCFRQSKKKYQSRGTKI